MANTFREVYKKTGTSSYQLVGNVGVDGVKLDIMKGASSSTAGEIGLVPKPSTGQQDYILTGSGTWQNISKYLGSSSISGIGDGTVKGAINVLNENFTKYKLKNTKVNLTTDAYGQCNILNIIGSDTVVLSIQFSGGYGGFCVAGGNLRIFRISSLPFQFAQNTTVEAYIFYMQL